MRCEHSNMAVMKNKKKTNNMNEEIEQEEIKCIEAKKKCMLTFIQQV